MAPPYTFCFTITNTQANTRQEGCVQSENLEEIRQRRTEYTEYDHPGMVCEVKEIQEGAWSSDLGYTRTIYAESGQIQLIGEGPVENGGFE